MNLSAYRTATLSSMPKKYQTNEYEWKYVFVNTKHWILIDNKTEKWQQMTWHRNEKKMIILFFCPSSSLKCCRITGCPKIGDLRDDTNSKIVMTAITILVTK